MATPMDHVLDYAPGLNRTGVQRAASGSVLPHGLEQPVVFDYDGLWQHTLPLLDVLRARYGHRRLQELGGSYGWAVRYGQRAAYHELQIDTLADYIDAFRAGGRALPYLRHISVHRNLPDLLPHLRQPAEFGPNWAASRWLDRLGGPELFLGQKGTGFGYVHQDHASVHVGFVQLQGEKEFVLFPPSDGPYLYRFPGQQFPYQLRNSWLQYADLENYERYPLLHYTNPRRLTLQAGQALLLPADWWHTTKNHSDSLSYSIRIVNATNVGRCLGQHATGIARAMRRIFASDRDA